MTDQDFRAAFAKMTPEERARYGDADDWQFEGHVGPRSRSAETAQFSLRVPRAELEALRNLAAHHGVTFSEFVRQTIASQLRPDTAVRASSAQPDMRWRLRITSANVNTISFRSDEILRDRTAYVADIVQSRQPEWTTPQSA
jgi:hypothetical protein